MAEEPPRVYTVEQVAKLLQLHPRTVNRILERGELRGIRAGRLWRVPVEALDEFLSGGQQGSKKGGPDQ